MARPPIRNACQFCRAETHFRGDVDWILSVIPHGSRLTSTFAVRTMDAGAMLVLVQRDHDPSERSLPRVTEIDSLQKSEAHITRRIDQFEARELFEIHRFQSGSLCGIVRLNNFDSDNRRVAIAYLLGVELQGRGIMTRMARAVLEFGFTNLEINFTEASLGV